MRNNFKFLALLPLFFGKAMLCAGVPSSISNLTALTGGVLGEITLSWTAPGGDGTTGTADGYLVVFSTTGQIEDDTDFSLATPYSQAWVPQVAGSAESQTATGLMLNTTYYWAIEAFH